MKFTMILLVIFSSLLFLALRMTDHKQGLKSEISTVKIPPAEGESSSYVSKRSPHFESQGKKDSFPAGGRENGRKSPTQPCEL